MDIILASASPRRRELLSFLGVKVKTADIDESFPKNVEISLAVQQLAAKKAAAVASKIKKDALVIGADTIVVLNNKVLGKPADEEQAYNMLSGLSGREHQVMTGVAVIRTKDGRMEAFCETTRVWFKKLSETEIREYIKTGEPMDKAGAYGIQGKGGALVLKTEGDFQNVVGLPVKRLLKLMREEFEFEGENKQ